MFFLMKVLFEGNECVTFVVAEEECDSIYHELAHQLPELLIQQDMRFVQKDSHYSKRSLLDLKLSQKTLQIR